MRTALLDSVKPCKATPPTDEPHKVTTIVNDEIVDVYYFDDWFDANNLLVAFDMAEDTTTKDLTGGE